MMLASVTGRSVTEGRIGVPQKMRLFLFPQSECAFPLKPPAPPFSPAQANHRRFSGPGPFGKIADAHQLANAVISMLIMLPGIMMLVRFVLPWNALIPTIVTGKPLVELGMVTAPPGPVYRVMVIAPLLVVNMNCACTTAGSTNSASAASAWSINK